MSLLPEPKENFVIAVFVIMRFYCNPRRWWVRPINLLGLFCASLINFSSLYRDFIADGRYVKSMRTTAKMRLKLTCPNPLRTVLRPTAKALRNPSANDCDGLRWSQWLQRSSSQSVCMAPNSDGSSEGNTYLDYQDPNIGR